MNKRRLKIGGIVLAGMFFLSMPFIDIFKAVGGWDVRGNVVGGIEKKELVQVKPANFEITLNMTGTLDAERSHIISSEIRSNNGKIYYIVPDGKIVEKDEVIVKLDPTPFELEIQKLSGEIKTQQAVMEEMRQSLEFEKSQLQRQITKAQFDLKIAYLNLTKIEKGEGPLKLSELKSEMDKAEQLYKRHISYSLSLEQLSKDGFENAAEIKKAKEKCEEYNKALLTAKENYTNYKDYVLPSLIESSKADVQNKEIEFAQLKKGGVFQIAKVQAEVEKTKMQIESLTDALQQSKKELEKTIIRAPFSAIAVHYESMRDGRMRKPVVGDAVWQNQPLLYLPDISKMIVKTEVRESDIKKAQINQNVTIAVDAYAGEFFKGKVTSIGAIAIKKTLDSGSEKFFPIEIGIEGDNTKLRPGMTARVNINSQHVNNALTVPIGSIFTEMDKTYCYVYQDGKYIKVEVKTGRGNEDSVEILSGLKNADLVSLVKPSIIQSR
ncbi:MAG: efflux RND transporter periplasmic adaptor subunit [Nitrospirae bacterium]|nr:efflux RND transporter periplasmic adaptor subunit [Nitrospirota bacterium]